MMSRQKDHRQKFVVFLGLLVSVAVVFLLVSKNGDRVIASEPQFVEKAEEYKVGELKMDSKSEAITTKMLNSHEIWSSVDGYGVFYDYGSSGSIQETSIELTVTNQLEANVRAIDKGANNSLFTIINTETKYQIDEQREAIFASPILKEHLVSDLSLLPTNLEDVKSNQFDGIPIVYPHPMSTAISVPPITSLIYPTEIVQGQGTFVWVQETKFLERKVDIIKRFDSDTLKETSRWDQLWVDQETGIVLRLDSYTGNDLNRMVSFMNIRIFTDSQPHKFAGKFVLDAKQASLRSMSLEEFYNIELPLPNVTDQ